MTPQTQIYFPALAMVALTFVVLGVMFRRRVAQMKRDRIHPQTVATSTEAAARYTDIAPADNFRNLFEMPVLFYTAILVAAQTGQTGPLVLGLAWPTSPRGSRTARSSAPTTRSCTASAPSSPVCSHCSRCGRCSVTD